MKLSQNQPNLIYISHIQITAWLSVFYIENRRRKKTWHSWNINIKQNETNIKMYLCRDTITGDFCFHLPSPSWRNLRSSMTTVRRLLIMWKSSKLQVIRHPSASNWTAVKISNVLKSPWKHTHYHISAFILLLSVNSH